jgi:hypothetical protein
LAARSISPSASATLIATMAYCSPCAQAAPQVSADSLIAPAHQYSPDSGPAKREQGMCSGSSCASAASGVLPPNPKRISEPSHSAWVMRSRAGAVV